MLLLVSGSGGLSASTLAVLVITPVELGMIRMRVLLAVTPTPMSPRLQVTVPLNSLQGPWAIAETKVTPGGSVSVRVTAVAKDGPSFLTLMM